MNLFDVNFEYVDELDPLYSLKSLFDVTGNCPESGFLAEEFVECGYNDNHQLEFKTDCKKPRMNISSQGTVLLGSVAIKQVRSLGGADVYYLYSWDVPDHMFASATFNNKEALDLAYQIVKDNGVNLCDVDIKNYFKDSGLSSSITSTTSKQELDPYLHMMDNNEKQGHVKVHK